MPFAIASDRPSGDHQHSAYSITKIDLFIVDPDSLPVYDLVRARKMDGAKRELEIQS